MITKSGEILPLLIFMEAHRTRTAAEMLNDIPSETAQQMLNAVRYQIDPPGSTMIPDLDAHMRENLELIPSMAASLNRGDVVEIQGPAASGKTQLLYYLAVNCILPTEVLVNSVDINAEHRVFLGGWQRSVVVLDCDGRWDIRRLHAILITRLNLAFSRAPLPPLPHNPEVTVSSIAIKSLSRLHLFRPTSSFQLAATLLTLPQYHAEHMPNEEIRLLLVDSISSFYWADRWQAEPSRPPKSPRSNPMGNVLRCIQSFRLSHGPVIILTNWGINPMHSTTSITSPASPTPFFKQHLAPPFPAPLDEPPRRLAPGDPNILPLTCHITLPFAFVSPLQLGLTQQDDVADRRDGGLQEALGDKRRKEVVERGEVGGYVRIPRSSRSQDTAPRSVVGRFKFRVLERDVAVAPTF